MRPEMLYSTRTTLDRRPIKRTSARMATAFLLALALLAQDAPVSTAPIASAPPPRTQPAATAPTDDYGYVGWCYGALGGYVELYDKVMPEVTRIEKTFPGPDGFAAAMKEYPAMRDQAKKDLLVYRSAIVAAEKASPRPISEYGATAIKKGHSVWGGADQVDKARLAQVWMSWSPPGDCDTRAKTLEKRSNLLGQALNYNVKKDAAPALEAASPEAAPPETAPAEAPAEATPATDAAPLAETAPPASAPKPKPAAKKSAAKPAATQAVAKPPVEPPVEPQAPEVTASQPLPTIDTYISGAPMAGSAAPQAKPVAAPAKAAAKKEVVIDPDNPQPCAGSLTPAKRNGKSVLICKAD
jgi:hypothetical protein